MNKTVEEQARNLAHANKQAQPYIQKVFWFPDETEIRLIEVEEDIPLSSNDYIEPFYFDPSPEDELFVPSAIALIRPEEIGHLILPDGWGEWNAGQVIIGDVSR